MRLLLAFNLRGFISVPANGRIIAYCAGSTIVTRLETKASRCSGSLWTKQNTSCSFEFTHTRKKARDIPILERERERDSQTGRFTTVMLAMGIWKGAGENVGTYSNSDPCLVCLPPKNNFLYYNIFYCCRKVIKWRRNRQAVGHRLAVGKEETDKRWGRKKPTIASGGEGRNRQAMGKKPTSVGQHTG